MFGQTEYIFECRASSTAIARQDCSCLIVPRQRLAASALRDGGPIAAAGSSVHDTACHSVHHHPCPHRRSCGRSRAETAASLNCVCSRDLHISAAPQALGTDCSMAALTFCNTLTGRRVAHSMLHNHAELAAPDQAQREAARARCGGKLNSETAAPVNCGTFHAARAERLFRGLARSSSSPATLFLSSNATGFDQDDAAGLAAERAFDCHLLEKGMLLEAAACECTLQMQPSTRPVYLRACRPRSSCRRVPAPQRVCKFAGCARKAAPRHACRRTPLLRVSCADAAAVAAPSHACLDCVYLPVVPDKPRLCTLIVGPLTSECDRVHCTDATAIQLPLPLQLS